jgi:hypothetical protein
MKKQAIVYHGQKKFTRTGGIMMRRFTLVLIIISVLAVLGLAACSGGQDAPAKAVEAYLQALVDKDTDRVVNLSCADWEADASVEVDSLEAVGARLEGVACQSSGTEGDETLVTCTGSLMLTYDGEDRPLQLEGRTYSTVREGGDWLMCGYR